MRAGEVTSHLADTKQEVPETLLDDLMHLNNAYTVLECHVVGLVVQNSKRCQAFECQLAIRSKGFGFQIVVVVPNPKYCLTHWWQWL